MDLSHKLAQRLVIKEENLHLGTITLPFQPKCGLYLTPRTASVDVTYLNSGRGGQDGLSPCRSGLALHFAWPPEATAHWVGRDLNFLLLRIAHCAPRSPTPHHYPPPNPR